jgi:hypothetical protein
MGEEEPSRGGTFDPEPEWLRWKRRDQWRIDDAACLLTCIDPLGPLGLWIKDCWYSDEVRIAEELRSGASQLGNVVHRRFHHLVRAVIDIRDCAETSRHTGLLEVSFHRDGDRGAVDPVSWLKWAAKKGYEIPAPLAGLVPPTLDDVQLDDICRFAGGVTAIDAAYDKRLAPASKEQVGDLESTASSETRRLITLQKLVLAMAKEKYGWEPGEKNPATGTKVGSIYADVIKQLGETRRIDADTIRRVLQQADKDFPPEE